MNPKRRKRLVIVLMIVVGVAVAVGLTLFALKQNINLFYSPTQISAGEAPQHRRIRAGGMVVKGSVKRAPDSLDVSFDITDFKHTVHVKYTGILPDLFSEEAGVVAQGELDEKDVFVADQVLAKHDENYMPPEVADSLKKAGMMPKQDPKEFDR